MGIDNKNKIGSLEMKRLALNYVVMGISCSISQVLLAREFMTVLGGNELILGVLLVNWLLCIALGSWGLGRLADRTTRRLELLVIVLILVSIVRARENGVSADPRSRRSCQAFTCRCWHLRQYENISQFSEDG